MVVYPLVELSDGLRLDRDEAQTVNDLIATSTEPISPDHIEVPEDLKGNMLVSSLDALVSRWREIRNR